MAGFSLILIFLWMGIVLLSTLGALVLLVISLVLFLPQKKTGSSGKSRVKKGFAVALLVSGCLILLPAGITACGVAMAAGRDNVEKIQTAESIENKIYVQSGEWRDGFAYEGKELVPVNLFMNDDRYFSNGKNQNLEKIGALVMEDFTYYWFYEVENNSGYDIYYVNVESFAGGFYYSRTFVDKEDYDAVLDYYSNAALVVRALWKSAPADTGLRNNWETVDLNPQEKQEELFGSFHAVLDDVSDRRRVNTTREGYDECTKLEILSEDGILKVDLCVYTRGEEVVLYLNEYEVESEIVETYREMLLSLTEDVQTKLLNR